VSGAAVKVTCLRKLVRIEYLVIPYIERGGGSEAKEREGRRQREGDWNGGQGSEIRGDEKARERWGTCLRRHRACKGQEGGSRQNGGGVKEGLSVY
jgi:hypothetical protein